MGLLFKNKAGGLMDAIRCDEQDYLVWKWHPVGSVAGNNKRENSIRWGSMLRVKPGEVVAFLYSQNRGSEPDYIEGPFDQKIETKNLPALTSLLGLAFNGDSPFQAEIYFINTAGTVQVGFVVPFFDVFDPRFPDFGVPVAVRGSINFSITDYKQFIYLHKLDTFDLKSFQAQIKDAVTQHVKGTVMNAPDEYQIPVVQIERRITEISTIIEGSLATKLHDIYGVTLTSVNISDIELDKTSDGYHQLMTVSKNLSSSKLQAQTDVEIQNMRDLQQINIENMREAARFQREETKYAQHMQTQSANITAHQINQQAAVGIAGAEGIGKMSNGGGGSGKGGSGFNPSAMIAGMAIGGAIGNNIAGTMNNMMGGISQPTPMPGVTPPPIPSEEYYVALSGSPFGPFNADSLKTMIKRGEINKDMLFWKEGMPEWKKGGEIPQIAALFPSMPPIPNC